MSWDRIRQVVVVTIALLAAAPAVAQAATVTTTADSGPGSLRQTILDSSSGDTIDFAPALNGQTITLTSGALQIQHAVDIEGPGATNLTINGNGTDRVFNIGAASTDDITIAGLKITGGSFTSTTSPQGGGGILFNGGRSLTLDGDAITGNQVSVAATGSAGGGGVYADSNELNVTNTTITNNIVTTTDATGDSNGGGGLYGNSATVTITGSVVNGNTVHETGTSNTSSDGGGGIYANSGTVDVTSSTVDNNTVTVDLSTSGSSGGGGIYSNSAQVTLGGATVDGNSFTLSDSQAGNNGGGGVYSNSGDVGVVLSSLDANTANVKDSSGNGADGGGGLFSDDGQIIVDESSISENNGSVNAAGGGGDNGGGAIFDESSGIQQFYLTSTFSGNSITTSGAGASSGGNGGGAIRTFGGGDASNMTIAANHATGLGGGVSSDSVFAAKNTIIADNTATIASANCAGSFSSSGFNLENANTCGWNSTGDLINTEPKLGPLQNNGGPTLTQALLAGSPAIDAGSCTSILGSTLVNDQRGVATPQPAGGKCDIGAYEAAGGSGGSGSPPSAPATVPGTPAATTSTAAAFSGTVNPNGQATTVSFQYGIDSRYRPGGGAAVIYDQSTPPQTLPADTAAHAVTASATGLVPNALYHVRLVATNATGTTFGPDQTFTTPASAAPPPPVLGQTVNVKPVSGQVFILVAGKLVPLTETQKIPSGAILDTRAGTLQLTAAAGSGHKTETGVFSGAIFKLTQARNGLANLALAEGAFPGAPSYATCKAHKAGQASAAATKTLQLLHASAKGKFRTTGRYSAATVRGTKWTLADRCDGTLTRDLVHSVAVTDFVRHKTIILHAGQSYLARRP